jgi:hypothetical protein
MVLDFSLFGTINNIIKVLMERKDIEIDRKMKCFKDLINEIYGPLYNNVKIINIYSSCFFKEVEKNNFIDTPSMENENAEWRLLIEDSLLPYNNKIESIITNVGYNFIEWPECIDAFLNHNRTMKDLVRRWKNDDYNYNFAKIHYPKDLTNYVEESYKELIKSKIVLEKEYYHLEKCQVVDETSIKIPVTEISLEGKVFSSAIDYLRKKTEFYLKENEYLNALVYFNEIKEKITKITNDIIANKYNSQFWKDYDMAVQNYIKNDPASFLDYVKQKRLRAFINYKLFYHINKENVVCEIVREEPKFILFKDEKLKEKIEKEFILYEEVEIRGANIEDSHYGFVPCKIGTKDGHEGFINSKNLWFYPEYIVEYIVE